MGRGEVGPSCKHVKDGAVNSVAEVQVSLASIGCEQLRFRVGKAVCGTWWEML